MNRNDWLRLSDRNALHIPLITHIKWHDPPPNGEPPDVATVFLADGRGHIVSHPDEVKVLRAWQAGGTKSLGNRALTDDELRDLTDFVRDIANWVVPHQDPVLFGNDVICQLRDRARALISMEAPTS